MRLALTGATGFLGRHVARDALARGHQVRALVREGAIVRAPPGVELVSGDLADTAAARTCLHGADVLVHLAARGVQSRDRDWDCSIDVNVSHTARWLALARDAGVGLAVVTGTCMEYAGHGSLPDHPCTRGDLPRCAEDASLETASAYGATKAASGIVSRAWAREAGVPMWYLRLASLYGPGDDASKFLPAAVRAALSGQTFAMTPGAQVREWMHVDDAARAILLAAEHPPQEVALVNVGTGVGVALRGVVDHVAALAGRTATEFVDASRPYRRAEAHHLVMDVTVAANRFGFRPEIALDAGLGALVEASQGRMPL